MSKAKGSLWRAFSVFKRWFGEYVSSLRLETIKKGLVFKVGVMNMLMMGGLV